MDGSFKGSPPGMRPRRPTSRCERKCDREVHRFPAAPRGISHPRSRPVSGLVGSVRIAFPRACAHSGWIDTPARTYRCGGSRGFGWIREPGSASAPLSRFTPARGTRRDTSNERVDCTTQVAELCFAAASGIYIEKEYLHP